MLRAKLTGSDYQAQVCSIRFITHNAQFHLGSVEFSWGKRWRYHRESDVVYCADSVARLRRRKMWVMMHKTARDEEKRCIGSNEHLCNSRMHCNGHGAPNWVPVFSPKIFKTHFEFNFCLLKVYLAEHILNSVKSHAKKIRYFYCTPCSLGHSSPTL